MLVRIARLALTLVCSAALATADAFQLAAADTVWVTSKDQGGEYHHRSCQKLFNVRDVKKISFGEAARLSKTAHIACFPKFARDAGATVLPIQTPSTPVPVASEPENALSTEQRVNTCAANTEDRLRLICYDALAGDLKAHAAASQPAAQGLVSATAPAATSTPRPTAAPPHAAPAQQSSGRCWVPGYTRKNGTRVNGYYRKC
jgi:hypothetical protein